MYDRFFVLMASIFLRIAPKLRSRIPKKKKTLYPSPDASETDASSDYATDDDRSSSASTLSTNSNNSLVARCSSINEVRIPHRDLTGMRTFYGDVMQLV